LIAVADDTRIARHRGLPKAASIAIIARDAGKSTGDDFD
jgi:hypothetical protein